MPNELILEALINKILLYNGSIVWTEILHYAPSQ